MTAFDGLLIAACSGAAWLLTRVMAQQAPNWGLLHPVNARSSHSDTTPHGGGLAIVASFALSVAMLHRHCGLPPSLLITLLAAGSLLAAVSLWDDWRPLPASTRLAVHGIAAIIAVELILSPWQVAPAPLVELSIGFESRTALTISGAALAIALTWWLNLYNFMDGIDGLAACEVLFLGSAACLLIGLTTVTVGASDAIFSDPSAYILAMLFALLAAASAGFLVTNWSPAQIFMGDVGSIFVGFTSGVLALASSALGLLPAWSCLILGAVFWTDSTVTLVRRLCRGQPLGQAHRQHAYQRQTDYLMRRNLSLGLDPASARRCAHRKACWQVTAINVLWLLPLAMLVIITPRWGLALTVVAFTPLLVLALQLPDITCEKP